MTMHKSNRQQAKIYVIQGINRRSEVNVANRPRSELNEGSISRSKSTEAIESKIQYNKPQTQANGFAVTMTPSVSV